MSRQPSGRGTRRRRTHPHPVDLHVGQRLRLRRSELGMSQGKLAEALGLTFQQVQKYERAANRIGASRLYELSRVLGVPIAYFFDEMDAGIETGGGFEEAQRGRYDVPPLDRDQVEIVTVFQRIADPATRRRLVELAKALGAAYFDREGA
jgi:transcriptional regulator with XRE-family HTH domain